MEIFTNHEGLMEIMGTFRSISIDFAAHFMNHN